MTGLRESEDSSGDMSIEEYLYRYDLYRSTTLSNPLIETVPQSRALIQPFRKEILEVLHEAFLCD
jgi:hypothetical protein